MRMKDADALKWLLSNECADSVIHGKSNEYREGLMMAYTYVNALPTFDMEPVRHGRNLKGKEQSYAFRCSECQRIAIDVMAYEDIKYCPFCGAKMDGGESDD